MPDRALKVLTVWQPWASLIIEGAKPFEFRGWRPPASLVGQRIVIHAAARKESADEVRTLLYQLMKGGQAAAMTCLRPDIAIPILQRAQGRLLSCGLGTAVVGEPRNGFDIAREFGVEFANDSDRDGHANWGWPMENIERWPEPVPARGRQGLWNWPTAEDAGL